MIRLYAVIAALLSAAAAGASQPPRWAPARGIELVAPSSPGGGPDVTARAIQNAWQAQRTLDVPVAVVNRPGGNYSVAWSYLSQPPADAHRLLMASLGLLTNRITGANAIDHADATTVAQLFSEFLVFAVRDDSPLRNGRDLMRQLSASPESVSFAVGGGAAGGIGHLAVAMAARAAGVPVRRLRVVGFKASPEAAAAALGGHVDVVVANAASLAPLAAAGSLRPLAITARDRQGGPLAAIPTWSEQGAAMAFDNVRFVLGAQGLRSEQVAWWEAAFESLAAAPEWRRHLETNLWSPAHLGASAARRALDRRQSELRALLEDLGLARQ